MSEERSTMTSEASSKTASNAVDTSKVSFSIERLLAPIVKPNNEENNLLQRAQFSLRVCDRKYDPTIISMIIVEMFY